MELDQNLFYNQNNIKLEKITKDAIVTLNKDIVFSCINSKLTVENKITDEDIIHFLATNYYYYNCEDVRDESWGCAWRCIQMILSSIYKNQKEKQEEVKFSTIFYKYGSKSQLTQIYNRMINEEDNKPLPNFFECKQFAPFENKSYWAEPFICQLICFDRNVKGKLLLINDYPNNAYAPKEVFESLIDFPSFKKRIESNFVNGAMHPIIIDDSIMTYCIIGFFYCKNKLFNIIIADPHVYESRNDKWEDFIYSVCLDNDESLLSNKFSMTKKNWMVFIID